MIINLQREEDSAVEAEEDLAAVEEDLAAEEEDSVEDTAAEELATYN